MTPSPTARSRPALRCGLPTTRPVPPPSCLFDSVDVTGLAVVVDAPAAPDLEFEAVDAAGRRTRLRPASRGAAGALPRRHRVVVTPSPRTGRRPSARSSVGHGRWR